MLPLSLLFKLFCLCNYVDASAVHALENVSLEVVWSVTKFFILGYQPMKSAEQVHNRQDVLANLIFIFSKLFTEDQFATVRRHFKPWLALVELCSKMWHLTFGTLPRHSLFQECFFCLVQRSCGQPLNGFPSLQQPLCCRMFYLQFSIYLTF